MNLPAVSCGVVLAWVSCFIFFQTFPHDMYELQTFIKYKDGHSRSANNTLGCLSVK